MYTRVNLRIRLFSFVISSLFHRPQLQTVRNHEFLRNGEEGGLGNPLDSKGLIKLHIVIFGFLGFYEGPLTTRKRTMPGGTVGDDWGGDQNIRVGFL